MGAPEHERRTLRTGPGEIAASAACALRSLREAGHAGEFLGAGAVKQSLRIKTFVGTSANALAIQIRAAITAMLVLKYLQLKSTFGWRLSNLVALPRQQSCLSRPVGLAERPVPCVASPAGRRADGAAAVTWTAGRTARAETSTIAGRTARNLDGRRRPP